MRTVYSGFPSLARTFKHGLAGLMNSLNSVKSKHVPFAPGDPDLDAFRQAQAGELPAGVGWEEVPITGSDVRLRRRAGASLQHHLIAHELAVVFAQGAAIRPVSGIRRVRAACPFPNIPEH